MREIKFKYGYSDSINTFEKAFTLEEIEQGLQFEEISNSPLLKNYKIVYKRQYTGLKDENDVEIYKGDICSFVIFDYLDNDTAYTSSVIFQQGSFGFIIKNHQNEECFYELSYILSQDDEVQVIGKIYENPDLLKG